MREIMGIIIIILLIAFVCYAAQNYRQYWDALKDEYDATFVDTDGRLDL